MVRKALIAASALLLATPAAAQSTTQDALQERNDRALAAGYKALFLCSAMANAERISPEGRLAEHIEEWELSGIQAPLDAIVPDLEYRIMRAENGTGALVHVEVDWSEEMPPRLAWHEQVGGCSLGPIGMAEPPHRDTVPSADPQSIFVWSQLITPPHLRDVRKRAFGDGYGEGTRTTAMIIAGAEGDPFYWDYARGFGPSTPQRTWSVAKSIAATVIGAAVHRGKADVAASARLGESKDDPRRAITIDHALRMASGRYSDTPGNRTDALYYGGASVDEVTLDWPLIHEPGSMFRYANNDTLAAVQAIEATFAEHPPAQLFASINMRHTTAETDWQGNYILSSQVWSTAPDLAKLGQLYLNNGVAPDGTRILPENWLEYVSTPSGPQPDGPLGYGASWWLINQSEGIPPDTIAALGNRGQILVVVPSRDIVIVRRGEDPVGSRFDFIAFTRDVLAALEE